MAHHDTASTPSEATLARLVRSLRERALLSQEELAQRSGLSVGTVRGLEAGRIRRPRSASVRQLADALGLTDRDRRALIEAARGEPAQAGAGQPAHLTVVPAQLPSAVPGFTGRTEALKALDELLPADPNTLSAPVVISAIGGTAGVGKTALAVQWAHQVADQFPDGQLYVNLRGYDPDQPISAANALARFLTALGVAGEDIPLDADDRAARYRTEIAGRRMLIVLDNASYVEQVRPLLPGTNSCAVVVTSRDSLAGLVAVDGAQRLNLDLLSHAEAIALLRTLIGPRVTTEPDAADTLAEQCARLPLALRITAELAISRPTTSLADLVTDLADQRRRLDLLDAGDPRAAVAAVFSWSIRHLPPGTARTFRLLGLHPGADFDPYAAAALAGAGLDEAHRHLDQLARAHLVYSTSADRYGMHDLLCAYATNLTATQDTDTERRAASGRLFDYYLAAAAAAMDIVHPAENERRPHVPPLTIPTPDLPDPAAALAWLDTQRPTLVTVAAHTAVHGWPTHAIRLSSILSRYLDSGHYVDAISIHDHARTAAEQIGDQAGQAQALLSLGLAHFRLSHYEPAADHYRHALTLSQATGDKIGEARALNNLSGVEQRLGRREHAAEHLRRALVLFRQAGHPIGEAQALNNLGGAEYLLGRYEVAADHHRQALNLYCRAGDRLGEASALSNIGLVEQRLGRYGHAAHHFEQALTQYRRVGDRIGEAIALDNLGTVHIHLDQPGEAVRYLEESFMLFRAIGDRDGEAWVLNSLGEAAYAAGHAKDAITHHTAAHTVATEVGAFDQQARAHAGLGHAHHALGDPTSARTHYEHAIALYTDLRMPDGDAVRTKLGALDKSESLK